jgi:preprotein translocase subunit SecD
MAVDANILIFERLKEELRAGRSLLSAMEIGFRRAWPAIRDSNISTFITCGILFFFGRELGEPRITGFAITLAIGVGLSMFSALMISRNFLQLLSFTGLGKNLGLFSPEGNRSSSEVLGDEK